MFWLQDWAKLIKGQQESSTGGEFHCQGTQMGTSTFCINLWMLTLCSWSLTIPHLECRQFKSKAVIVSCCAIFSLGSSCNQAEVCTTSTHKIHLLHIIFSHVSSHPSVSFTSFIATFNFWDLRQIPSSFALIISNSQTPITPRNQSCQQAKLGQAKASPDLCGLMDLNRNINWNKKLCTIAWLQEMLDFVGVDHQKLGWKPKRNKTVKHNRKHAVPVIQDVLLYPQLNQTSSLSSSPSSTQTLDMDAAMNKPSTSMVESSSKQPPFKTAPVSSQLTPTPSQSTPTSSVENMQTTSHISKSGSKVNEVCQCLKKSVGKMVSSRFDKGALLKLKRHITNLCNNSPNPPIPPG